jgi:uncharacterized protein YndB with AHSA1/START domain
MQPQPDSSDSLVFECDLEEPPQKVWRALTEPHLLNAWLSDDSVRSEPVEIVSAEPPRLVCYRFRDKEEGGGTSGAREVHSTVTVELAPGAAGGTHLRLTHGEFRVVALAPPVTATGVRPITSARRRTRVVSFAGQASWRRAA